MLNKRSLELEFKLIIYAEAISIEVFIDISNYPVFPKCHLRLRRTCLLEWANKSSPLRQLVPLFVRGAATSRADRNNESERGLECVRDVEAEARAGVRAGAGLRDGGTVPGSQARNASASNKAYPPPFTPLPFLAVLPDS